MAEMVRDGELAGRLAAASAKAAALPAHERAAVLTRISEGLAKRAEEFARLICAEVKKPIKDARREVARAVFTFRWAGQEALRLGGEVMPLDLEPGSEGRLALTRRFPRGPALLISPFNFPLNLAAHKIAPAIAVGAPYAHKPSSFARRTAEELGRLVAASGWPAEAAAVVAVGGAAAEALVKDERFGVLSFTGSGAVGWRLKSLAGKKAVLLELGGNAGVFVGEDADLEPAAARCAWGANAYAGQVCIKVQRIFVHEKVYSRFKDLLLRKVAALKVGDPSDEQTDVGPLITEAEALRVESWVQEAVSAGASVLCGGKRRADFFEPTVLEGVPESCRVSCDEVFGPVTIVAPVSSPEEGLRRLADTRYGLQAGLFTKDLNVIMRFWERLPVGGIIVGDVPTFRSDAMPYGGAKDSGIGREGVRFSMEEYTELRTLVLRP
ncbi:MAG: aldehyde dehydrogenase family protein [Elusimicrobia bacterium]|nr:aldehyde dehydrogenase family protein [Elusimicrobiota bacterium]